MEPNRTVTLCPECGACPEIKLFDDEVLIGEEENMVRLSTDEWNSLVDKILDGELRKV